MFYHSSHQAKARKSSEKKKKHIRYSPYEVESDEDSDKSSHRKYHNYQVFSKLEARATQSAQRERRTKQVRVKHYSGTEVRSILSANWEGLYDPSDNNEKKTDEDNVYCEVPNDIANKIQIIFGDEILNNTEISQYVNSEYISAFEQIITGWEWEDMVQKEEGNGWTTIHLKRRGPGKTYLI